MMYLRNRNASWVTLYQYGRHVNQGGMRNPTSQVMQTNRKDAGRKRGRFCAHHKHQPEKIWEL